MLPVLIPKPMSAQLPLKFARSDFITDEMNLPSTLRNRVRTLLAAREPTPRIRMLDGFNEGRARWTRYPASSDHRTHRESAPISPEIRSERCEIEG
jgi:hypothetical protein